jgi:hypothetical protein
MTLDPTALEAARKAAAAHMTGEAPRWESGAAAAERIVAAYLAALDRDPLVEAAREVSRVRGSSNFSEINRALDALDAALRERDETVGRDDPDYCTQEQINRANALGRRGAKMVRRTRP